MYILYEKCKNGYRGELIMYRKIEEELKKVEE